MTGRRLAARNCSKVTAAGPVAYALCFLAAAFAAANVVGGYVVTDRMLGMFRGRP